MATPKPKPPVTTERTGNPKDKMDWTNSPSSKAWAKLLKSKVNPDGSAKKAALAKKIASTKKPMIPASPTK